MRCSHRMRNPRPRIPVNPPLGKECARLFQSVDRAVPLIAPELIGAKRLVVRIESGTHYIQGLYTADGEAIDLTYGFSDYERLGSLPSRDGVGRRSLFTSRGMVSGSERAESTTPGQCGPHFTAFVGHRHSTIPTWSNAIFCRQTVGHPERGLCHKASGPISPVRMRMACSRS